VREGGTQGTRKCKVREKGVVGRMMCLYEIDDDQNDVESG